MAAFVLPGQTVRYPALAVAFTLVCLLASPPGNACVTPTSRSQIVVLPKLSSKSTRMLLPSEYTLRAGDLLPVFVPRGAAVHVMDAQRNASDIAQALEPDRYKVLSAQGRGRIPIEVRDFELPQHEWLYFGAVRPGVAYLAIQSKRGNALIRITVDEPPLIARGEALVLSEAQQDQPITISPLDSLNIELPGRPGDGWQAAMSGAAANIRSIAEVESQEWIGQPRVRIRLFFKLSEPQHDLLIQNSRNTYRFTLKVRSSVAAC